MSNAIRYIFLHSSDIYQLACSKILHIQELPESIMHKRVVKKPLHMDYAFYPAQFSRNSLISAIIVSTFVSRTGNSFIKTDALLPSPIVATHSTCSHVINMNSNDILFTHSLQPSCEIFMIICHWSIVDSHILLRIQIVHIMAQGLV